MNASDVDDLFIACTFDDVDDLTRARARRALRDRENVARAYRVLDEIATIGFDAAAVRHSPLALLLEESVSRRPTHARTLPQIVLTSTAAAAVLFFLVIDDAHDTKAMPERPMAVVNVKSTAGPLDGAGVVRGLNTRFEALGRCSAHPVDVDVRFRVRGDGLVENAVASGRARAEVECVEGVVERTAFELHDEATDVHVSIALHPGDKP